MEALIKNIQSAQVSYQILGDDSQILQIILGQNCQIICQTDSILTMSSEIKMDKYRQIKNKNNGIFSRFWNYLTELCELSQNAYYKLSNPTNQILHLELQKRLGKVLVLNGQLFSNLIVKKRSLLAISSFDDIDLKCLEFDIKTIKNNGNYISKQQWLQIKNPDLYFFVQSNRAILEKELGEDEKIIIKQICLIAFSYTCKFSYVQKDKSGYFGNLPSDQIIQISGPGIVFVSNDQISHRFPHYNHNTIYPNLNDID
ncbi:biogenesis AIM24 protein (macronuclear) [Tetrahymena thermophila SB210]|uniref:Biogenesis AIM24 protein n=1 Tax=Tetrahymena thermophila (strain SB210) TaxID=312017 RepID=I7M9V4_TETTS|nr:biogenesis AIM24 protein [Tetrahymena thermophila SB210]EAS02890.2 biogenesis AIM24 protein [Tetrahymena thermophila SB210]|eukprot:XP_001023135.2 biogenesis AIM24 protein [Tetrahymena thermophila SB210]